LPEYTVQPGDCISSIAYSHGFYWETIWDLPENAALKGARKDPNVLFPGDKVFIPEKRIKWESRNTEARHRFMLRGVPAKFKVLLAINDQPLANKPYTFWIDDKSTEGKTDSNGFVAQSIPPGAERGKIVVKEVNYQLVWEFQFGTVDPIDTEEGVRERLTDMGYDAENDLEASVRAFQQKEKLDATGQIDETTRAKIQERFGQ
jgi:hypothetical protein